MDIYGHIYIYSYIYVFWRESISLSLPVMTVALYLPMAELSAPTPPIVDMFFRNWSYESVPMDRGIILCFRRKVGFDLFLQVRSSLFEKTQISILIIYLQRSIIVIFGKKGSYLFEKGSYFLRRAFIFLRFPLWTHCVVQ